MHIDEGEREKEQSVVLWTIKDIQYQTETSSNSGEFGVTQDFL